MSLLDAFLLEPAKINVWVALRPDGFRGDGSANNPLNGRLNLGLPIPVVLAGNMNEALGDTTPRLHGFAEGDMIQIGGVTGAAAAKWNRAFMVYEVTPTTFKFGTGELLAAPGGFPTASLVTFQFDKIMRELPPNTRVNLGPGVFQTRGYAPKGVGRWSPKSGQKIVGSGIDVTTLQLVGAGVIEIDNGLVEQHYHTIGTPIVPEQGSTTGIAPLENFEVSNLTIDCNLDNQPLRAQGSFTPVACGALRVLGSHCRIHNVKAVNWGTKSLRQGCFVISLIGASAEPNGVDGNPIITVGIENGIENCIVISPSRNCARETTVLHLGGVRNSTNHAQTFASAGYVRKNFIDCSFGGKTPAPLLLTATPAARVNNDFLPFRFGEFYGKRRHGRANGEFIRFHNPRNAESRWNGYFSVVFGDEYTLYPILTESEGTNDDSSLVVMGSEFRAIAVTSGEAAVVENNQIHDCWIGGPYQSPMDDSVSDPTTPPTLAREERLDPLNALNTRSLIVRDNVYRNVAVGPYLNMGGVSGTVSIALNYESNTGLVTGTTTAKHNLWLGARIRIEDASDSRFNGVQEVRLLDAETDPDQIKFTYQLAANLGQMPRANLPSKSIRSRAPRSRRIAPTES